MFDHSETVTLEDGCVVTVRARTKDDLDKTMEFYLSMPEEERELMRVDITDREVVARRFEEVERGHAARLVAESEGKIVGEAILEHMRYGWLRKTGEIRILITPRYRGLELAQTLAQEVFLLAARRGLNNLIARVLDGETEMMEILKGLHFKHDATQKDHAVDMHGDKHDVHLLTFSLSKMWRDIEDEIRRSMPPRSEH